jgi:ParB family chromosome partitioning protein
MQNALGTKVRIHEGARGRGRIEIEYYSQDDLDRIYELIVRT